MKIKVSSVWPGFNQVMLQVKLNSDFCFVFRDGVWLCRRLEPGSELVIHPSQTPEF